LCEAVLNVSLFVIGSDLAVLV